MSWQDVMQDVRLTVRDVEERRAEYGGAEESEEYRRRDEIVRDVLAAHVGQTLAEYTEALPQFERKVSVAGQYPAPGELHGVPQILLLLVKGRHRGDLQRVHLAVATLYRAPDHGSQGLLQVPIARQLQVGLHRLRG